VVLSAATIDGATVNAVLAHFSIQNRYMRGTDSANTTTPPTAAAIADAVWDEATAGHTGAGTTGLKLLSAVEEGDLPGEPPAASAIADAVWDEALAGHLGAGSAGLKLISAVEEGDLPNEPPAASAIADAVWDEALAGHAGAGSAGAALAAAGGGSSPEDIADAVWDEALAGHAGAGSAGAALAAAGAAGISAGAVEFTYTAADSNSDPLEGVEVWITTDDAGSNLIWYGTSDAFGIARSSSNAKPMLDAGTYYFWSKKGGYTFTNPDTVEVTEP